MNDLSLTLASTAKLKESEQPLVLEMSKRTALMMQEPRINHANNLVVVFTFKDTKLAIALVAREFSRWFVVGTAARRLGPKLESQSKCSGIVSAVIPLVLDF